MNQTLPTTNNTYPFPDKQACHRFSRVHSCIIRHMVLPQCNTQRHNVEMVVDDVVVINPAHQPDTLAAFDEAYSTTMERIGLKTKPADPTGFKAFRELTRGEVLGFIIDTETLSWNFGLEKRDKIILALEATYNKHDINRPVLINLKTAQRAYGKLNAITACWTHIKAWLIFISRDIGKYIIRNPGANDAPARQQKLNFQFSFSPVSSETVVTVMTEHRVFFLSVASFRPAATG